MNKDIKHINKFLLQLGEVESVFSVDENQKPLVVSVYRKNAEHSILTEKLLIHAGIDFQTVQAVKCLKPEEAEEIKKIARIKTLKKELEELEKSLLPTNKN